MKRGAGLPPRPVTGAAGMHVRTTPIAPGGAHDQGPWWLMLATLAFVALAVVKPWGSGAHAPGSEPAGKIEGARPEAGPSGSPAPTLAPTPPSADEVAGARCNDPLGWRSYAMETWRGQTIRSFVVVEPLAATEAPALDEAGLPDVPLIGEAITAVGYCAPTTEAGHPPTSVTVGIWQADPAGLLRPLPVVRIEPAQPSSLMALFAYPSSALDWRAPWPAGRYLLGVLGPPGSDYGRWFAFDVVPFVEGSTP